MSEEEPNVLTRMRLSCCWGDNLNEKELNEVIDYINQLQQENKQLKERTNKAIEYISSNDIEVLKYHDIPSETTSYEIVTIDLLKILKGGENEY